MATIHARSFSALGARPRNPRQSWGAGHRPTRLNMPLSPSSSVSCISSEATRVNSHFTVNPVGSSATGKGRSVRHSPLCILRIVSILNLYGACSRPRFVITSYAAISIRTSPPPVWCTGVQVPVKNNGSTGSLQPQTETEARRIPTVHDLVR